VEASATRPCSNKPCPKMVTLRISADLCEACYCYQRLNGKPRRKFEKSAGYYRTGPHGYLVIRQEGHPLAHRSGWVYEHRFVAYVKHGGVCPPCFWCGRHLQWKKAVVDHLNEQKADNRPENVEVSCNTCNRMRGLMIGFIQNALPERLEQFISLVREQNAKNTAKRPPLVSGWSCRHKSDRQEGQDMPTHHHVDTQSEVSM
jgi:hypothetical protein